MDITVNGACLVLDGEFDGRSTAEVRDALYRLLGDYDGDIVVDLTAVRSVDLTALRVLAVATRRAMHEGHRLQLRGCCPAVRRMLHKSRLYRVVDLERAPTPV